MCRSMVDIQSVAAEIRRGKKIEEEEEERKKETTGQKYNGPLLHRAAINMDHLRICLQIIVKFQPAGGSYAHSC